MTLSRVNWGPALLRALVARKAFADSPFVLLDIGCGGGIDGYWREFGDELRVVAVDPDVAECERLGAAETHPAITYVDAWIRCTGFPAEIHERSNQSFPRTSAAAAAQIFAESTPGVEPRLSQRQFGLDELVDGEGLSGVDFVKIDTDGGDLEVLHSAAETLRTKQVLGLSVESQFHGGLHDKANLFSNIDRLLREAGFSLFDLEVYRYSRAALPDRFVYSIPAQTNRGQVAWGEALYLRDAAHPDYSRHWGTLSGRSILKLACLFEIFGMNDCAAEVILRFPNSLGQGFSSRDALEILTREWWPRVPQTSYIEVTTRFSEDPKSFYPQDVD